MSGSELQREIDFAKRRLDRRTLHRLLALLRPQAGAIAAILLLQAIAVLAIVARPWFIGQLADVGLVAELEATELDWTWALILAAGLTGLWLGRFVFLIIARVWAVSVVVDLLADLRIRLYDHVQSLSVRFFDRTRAGRVVARVDRDVESLQPLFLEGIPQLLGMVLRCAGGAIMLSLVLPQVLWGLLILAPLLLASIVLFKRIGTAIYGRINEQQSRVTAHLVETVSGVRLIQQSVAEDRNKTTYNHLLNDLDRAAIVAAWGWGWFMPYIFLLFTLGICVVIIAGGGALAADEITPGRLIECIFYVFLFLGPLMEVGDLFERASSGAAAGQRIFLLLDNQPEIQDDAHARPLDRPFKGQIDIAQVHFRYDENPAADWVLKDINLHIASGSTVAIVGPTGHGKSTLVQLLTRFYDPQQGSISIDGRDLRGIPQADLRRHVALVLQDNVLFSGTVLANLRLARPDMSDEALIAQAENLEVSRIIEQLPQGWYSEVGPRGEFLSHGQRQVICLLRAWIADPTILILDEATSAVDVRTEGLIQKALTRVMSGRTAIVVAHRLATIRDADRIVVVQHGRIVEDGDHTSLITDNGLYSQLYANLDPAEPPEDLRHRDDI
ncbi:MAG: ABC transporter ATP-binding protein [Planctomycetota bacterium]|nr:MAG: ABC transporter ATP-binding protein [Planctomycetota bacterium]